MTISSWFEVGGSVGGSAVVEEEARISLIMTIMSAIIVSSRPMRSSVAGFGCGDGGWGGDGDVKVQLETWASKPMPNVQPLFLPPTATSHIFCSIIANEASDSAGLSWSMAVS
ncbi:UNVERIFIED_CONTAM: hypothetical protein Sindi_2501800 [Sesamum indicum]